MTRRFATTTNTPARRDAPPDEVWPLEQIRSFANIGTGAKDTQDRSLLGKYPFFVRSQKVERIDSWTFNGEAVLTAGDGVGTGKVFHYINGKFDYHQRVYRISNFDPSVSGKYFYYQFSRKFLARIESLTAKSSVDSVRMETIAGMTVPVPTRAEQEQIVESLDDAVSMVDGLERLITKKRAIKQGMMQLLLSGQSRLTGFSQPWETRTLGDISRVVMGQSPPSASYNQSHDGLPLVQGNADIRDRRTIARVYTTQPTKRCAAGDVVLTVRAPVGYTAIASMDACLGRGVCALNAGDSNSYLYNALVYAEKNWSVFEQGSTFTAVNSAHVRGFELRWPQDPGERLAIGKVLDDAELEIAGLRARVAKANAVKQGMMQELLTGRARLVAQEVAR